MEAEPDDFIWLGINYRFLFFNPYWPFFSNWRPFWLRYAVTCFVILNNLRFKSPVMINPSRTGYPRQMRKKNMIQDQVCISIGKCLRKN
jgi:hypothetical protein